MEMKEKIVWIDGWGKCGCLCIKMKEITFGMICDVVGRFVSLSYWRISEGTCPGSMGEAVVAAVRLIGEDCTC